MGSVDLTLAADLRDALGLVRAVETGTYRGKTARSLATVLPAVITIELSQDLHAAVAADLKDTPAITSLQGDSVERLAEVADPASPTLFFLDGHWSGEGTAGEHAECPVIAELAVIGAGNPDDCVIVDDARMFTSAPAPPHDPAEWPTLMELCDAIREHRPDHFVTLLDDQVIAVPQRARPAIDAYGQRLLDAQTTLVDRAKSAAFQARSKLSGRA